MIPEFQESRELENVPLKPAPLLSVIVPCYNSSAMLEKCLAALAGSDFTDFDVLVVDDGSTEPIEPIVRRHGFAYMKIDGPSGPGRARNHGVQRVRGTYLVFVDADVVIHRDTLRCFAEAVAREPRPDAVIGTYDDTPAHPSFLSQYKNLFHHYVHQSSDGPVSTFWAGCGAMRRDVFLKFGGFDEKLYRRPAIEDIELGTWVAAAGHRIVLESRIRCTHLKRWTLKNLLKTDIFDRGIPWTKLMLRAGALANTLNVKSSQRVSVALAYLTLMAVPVAMVYPYAWSAVAALMAGVTLLNLDFYRYFAARRGLGFTLRVVPMHWLYFWYCGLSFAVGTIQHRLAGSPKGTPPPTSTQTGTAG